MEQVPSQSAGSASIVVLVKALPRVGAKHGETVCCAGLDEYGKWHRLYPVSFNKMEDAQRFTRWDRIDFRWRRPNDDNRQESRRVEADSLVISGKLSPSERQRFLGPAIVTSTDREFEAGRSLALLQMEVLEFLAERRSRDEMQQERDRFAAIRGQQDMFSKHIVKEWRPCPYKFRYRYRSDDGERTGTCQDWEVYATYFRYRQSDGEQAALAKVHKIFGERYPREGMLLAMGTHSRWPSQWLINGIVRLDPVQQTSLFSML